MIQFVVYVLFGLLEPIIFPPVIALEVASVWLEGHPLAVWAAVILGLSVWVVKLYDVDDGGSPEGAQALRGRGEAVMIRFTAWLSNRWWSACFLVAVKLDGKALRLADAGNKDAAIKACLWSRWWRRLADLGPQIQGVVVSLFSRKCREVL